jgi:hypothetical protein
VGRKDKSEECPAWTRNAYAEGDILISEAMNLDMDVANRDVRGDRDIREALLRSRDVEGRRIYRFTT